MEQQANFRRNLIFSTGLSILILLISSTASFLSIRKLIESSEWVNHTQKIILDANQTYANVIQAQNSMRGYLYSGQESFVSDYNNIKISTRSNLNQIKQATVDNPDQQIVLTKLDNEIALFFEYIENKISMKQRNLPIPADDIMEGKARVQAIGESFNRILTIENQLLKERSATANTYASTSLVLILGAALIAVIVSLYFFTRILQDFAERSRLTRKLRDKEAEIGRRIAVISDIAGQIARGNLAIRVNDAQSDELGSVAGSLNEMAQALEESFSAVEDSNWKQKGMADLATTMMGDKTVLQLTNEIVEFVCNYVGAQSGMLFLIEDDMLYPTSGFAADVMRAPIRMGEGITGQAASTGRIVEIRGLKPEAVSIKFALGDVAPVHIMAIPLKDLQVEGVLEIAASRTLSERETEFLESIGQAVGVSLRSAKNRQRVQELLEETEAQAEELKAQHSELEHINTELEIQTEKLQASEEELRVQQEELIQTNEELSERGALLEERNIEIQKKSEELEVTTRYKSEFLANMSHELRTPLNSILLLSRLLAENNQGNMTEEQIEFANVIQSSGSGLLGLIDEILDLSKIEAGKMDLELLETPIQSITQSLKGLFEQVALQKGIRLNIDTSKAPLVIKTDKMRLEQILKNLISNAIKFTEQGEVTLTVKQDPTNKKQVLFSVRDTGIGIPKDKQRSIFEAFQQADGSTKRKYGGTGLGLSISRQLARLLKGDIALESEPGKGSDFILVLPISGSAPVVVNQTEVIETAPETQVENTPVEDPYVTATIPEDVPDDRDEIKPDDKVILIVEDDVVFAKQLLRFSRERGYKGVVTVRGDQVLDLALLYQPAGILLDIQLPVRSGWDVMSELKNSKQTKHIPVHIMSSLKVRQESLLKGAVNFLDKPVAYEQIPEVFRRIEQIVNRESQKVLIIEDNPKHAEALAYFLESYQIHSEIKSEISDGMQSLVKKGVQCVILDMGIPDKTGYELLENLKKENDLEGLPVIVFTGKSLSMNEEMKIKKFADSIVVKTAHSYRRMLDEVSLFLHLVEDKKNKAAERTKNSLLSDSLTGKTVLVVDDDVRNIYSLTKALEVQQMKVITAIDGAEALKMLEDNPQTDVVLLDMMMPNMDGYETAQRIRKINKFKNLPVIAVTAKAMMGDREKCIQAGASDYITKPVDVDQLLSLLRVWLYQS